MQDMNSTGASKKNNKKKRLFIIMQFRRERKLENDNFEASLFIHAIGAYHHFKN